MTSRATGRFAGEWRANRVIQRYPFRGVRHSMFRARIATAVVLGLAACVNGSDSGELRSETTEAGDTITVTTRGEPVPTRIDIVEVVWQSPELENPRALIAMGDKLVIADPRRLHILSTDGEHVQVVGRRGEGPGEFGWITGLSNIGRDTVAALDAGNQRVSYFTILGEYLESVRITAAAPWVNAEGPAFAMLDGGAAVLWSELVHTDRPTRTALVWHDLSADTATVLATWNGEQYVDYGGMFAPARLFGPRVIAALAADGRLAVGDGVEFCVRFHTWRENTILKACRDRQRVPVGSGIRNPDLSVVEDERRAEALRAIFREQETGELMPSFDRLLFGPEGQLWVRTIGAESADVHPYLRVDMPEREPEYRTWDVFDENGNLTGAVDLPSKFSPQAATAGRIFGFLELASGEVVIGAVAVPSMN